ncbi:hypothetical protein DPMN_012141 [Dreissena polymorpha]|uniref:Uncharacterized protein n=1 Tax=Dreissena polymorpha TaxID=45954 RepID=A0A9D4N5B2_DREPO|nr:hypothetical protein DPMN_012141 [Dreissena polymorpha]
MGVKGWLCELGDGLFVNASVSGVQFISAKDTGAPRTIISQIVNHTIPEGDSRRMMSGNSILGGALPIWKMGNGLYEPKLGDSVVERELVISKIDDAVLLEYDVLAKVAAGSAEILNNQGVMFWMVKKLTATMTLLKYRRSERSMLGGLSEGINVGCLNQLV